MEMVLIYPLILGLAGFAIGAFLVFTMPASAARRFIAAAAVLLAAILGIGVVIIGAVRPLGGFAGALLVPVLTAIGLRFAFLRRRG